jgi:predicted XRE-type DNA-binding protein
VTDIEQGSGNVYADLGFADAEEMHAKAQLVTQLAQRLTARGWSPQQAAQELGWPRLPEVLRGHFHEVERTTLLRALAQIPPE